MTSDLAFDLLTGFLYSMPAAVILAGVVSLVGVVISKVRGAR